MGLETTTNLFRTEGVFGCDISTFFTRNNMNKLKQKPVTEEVKKWSSKKSWVILVGTKSYK